MLQLENIKLAFGGHTLFENVSFTLQKGEKCAFVGRNGSGKSTLLKLIIGELEMDEGSISIPKGYILGYLRQHITFTKSTLREEAALGLREEDKDHLYKVEKILFGLGFTQDDLNKSPSLFSGGYHLRLHLAKVLVSEPDCLLLDEPTNYLDILSIRFLKNFLQSWKGECIIISHERDFIDEVATHTMGLHRGQIKKVKGSTLQYYEQILLDEEIHEKTRLKQEKKKEHLLSFIERFGAKATKATQAQSRKKQLEKEPILEKLNSLENLQFHFLEAPFPGKKMIEGDHLSFSYTELPLIRDFNFEIEKGKKIAIIGKNGRGKSTLLRLIGGELEPQAGKLEVSPNVKVGYFGQTNIEKLAPHHTIYDEISAANPDLNISQVKAIAGKMLFSGDLSEKKISVLSGGEKSRVLLAKILARSCNLLLLDEPTHHLDIESVESLIDAIEDFEGSVVIVTHSELILRRIAFDQLILCEPSGQKVFLGDYDLFLEKQGWEEEKKVSVKNEKSRTEKKKKPSQWKIKEIEEKIAALEKDQKEALSLLEKENQSGAFFIELKKREEELGSLYQTLEELYSQLD